MGNVLSARDTKFKVKGQKMYFLVNASPDLLNVGRSNFKLCRCIYHMMKRILGNLLYDPKIKVKGKRCWYLGWCTIDYSLVLYILNFNWILIFAFNTLTVHYEKKSDL